MERSTFDTLNQINVNDHTEKKNGLTYLSWAWAWAEVKKAFPDANYTVYENPIGRPWFDDGRTGWVKTGVTIGGIEHIEYLPVMDFKNKSIPADSITSFDANKAVQRSLTKACARHGLGLYIYAGEDLPEGDTEKQPPKTTGKTEKDAQQTEKPSQSSLNVLKAKCEQYGVNLTEWLKSCNVTIETVTADQVAKMLRTLIAKYGD